MVFSERAAEARDLPWLLALRERTIVPHLEAAGQFHDDAHQRAVVLTAFEAIRIITVAGEDGGRREVGMSKLVEAPDCWELMQFQIEPAAQGRGLGRAVLDGMIDRARAAGAALELDCLKANPAQRLYERAGFRRIGEHHGEWRMRLEPDGAP